MERIQTTIRFPEDILHWLQKEADRLGISVNAVVIMCIQKIKANSG